MSTPRDFTIVEIDELRTIVDSDLFVDRVKLLSKVYPKVRNHPIPNPLDSEAVVAALARNAASLLAGLQKARIDGHPLALSMRNKGFKGGNILRNATQSLDNLVVGLDAIKVMARPGLKKSAGRRYADTDKWLADELADLLDSYNVPRSNYKQGPLARCINIARTAAGITALTDPCKAYKWIAK